jgi:hypothetical protein
MHLPPMRPVIAPITANPEDVAGACGVLTVRAINVLCGVYVLFSVH